MNEKPRVGLTLCCMLLPVFVACWTSSSVSSASAVAAEPIDYPNPVVENVPGLDIPFVAGTTFPLADVGYERHEYFFSGEADSYVNDAPLDRDGNWQVSKADRAHYKTRMLVYRPSDPARFNGTVVVEWLNVTAGVDTAADWVVLHNELIRGGYVWVGISAQKLGVEGGGKPPVSPLPIAIPLKLINPIRYASLSHPGDSFSYDIYAQAAQAIRHPQGVAPLGELRAQRLIAAGESQSATRLTTFIDAFGARTDLFDGYFVHSRLGFIPDFGGASAPLSQDPQANITTPEVVRFRTDLGKPLLDLQTETDLFVLGAYGSRQDDGKLFRLWEVPGTSHADTYITGDGFKDEGDVSSAQVYETKKPGPIGSCPEPVNSAPQHHFVGNAAIRALNAWLVDGIAPPKAPRIRINDAGDGIERDALGNALGGIRSPYLDVPTAVLSGENASTQDDGGICFLVGRTALLDAAALQARYPDHAAYVAAVHAAAQDAVDEGFLLSEDAQLINEAAAQGSVP